MELIQIDGGTDDSLFGAGCSLEANEMPARLREWTSLRERATGVREIPGGVALSLDPAEPLEGVVSLAARESECCPFYTFDLRVQGPVRELHLTAGEGREIAVRALLGIS